MFFKIGALKYFAIFTRKHMRWSLLNKVTSLQVKTFKVITFLINVKVTNQLVKIFKGGLSGLRQSLATEIRLKIMKNTFYFILKVLFVLKIFKFSS